MTIIIILILTGIFLLILEFFVFPGITISGIGGVISTGIAIYLGYSNYGGLTGTLILISTVVLFAVLIIIALRAKTWKRFSLETTITGQVETVEEEFIKPGDKGITITRLNPVGKARVNDKEVEAQCPGKYVEPKTEIEVVKVFKNYIIVKQLNR
jgi:membrane-bound ClpP family serine protease